MEIKTLGAFLLGSLATENLRMLRLESPTPGTFISGNSTFMPFPEVFAEVPIMVAQLERNIVPMAAEGNSIAVDSITRSGFVYRGVYSTGSASDNLEGLWFTGITVLISVRELK